MKGKEQKKGGIMRIQSLRKSEYTNSKSRRCAANSMLVYSQFKPFFNRFFVPLDLNRQVNKINYEPLEM